MSEHDEASSDKETGVIARLRELGFRTPDSSLRAWLRDAHRQRLGPTETVERAVELERHTRDANNLARRTRLAMLGTPKALDKFDWQHPRSIDRGLYESLLGLDFLRTGENVLLRGPSGVGKTTLAQHLGLAALARGYTVCFSTLSTVMADLLKQESLPATERHLKRYIAPDLLLIDEIGYLPCESRAADLLYTIVSRRGVRGRARRSLCAALPHARRRCGLVAQEGRAHARLVTPKGGGVAVAAGVASTASRATDDG